MKKFFIISMILFLGVGMNDVIAQKTVKVADKLKWYSWNEGYPKAKKENKILLVDMYTDWCKWCKVMDRETYSKEDIQKTINQYFIPVKFNPEKQGVTYNVNDRTVSGRELQASLANGQRIGYPTTFFLIPTGNNSFTLYTNSGYLNPDNFRIVLKRYIEIMQK